MPNREPTLPRHDGDQIRKAIKKMNEGKEVDSTPEPDIVSTLSASKKTVVERLGALGMDVDGLKECIVGLQRNLLLLEAEAAELSEDIVVQDTRIKICEKSLIKAGLLVAEGKEEAPPKPPGPKEATIPSFFFTVFWKTLKIKESGKRLKVS